MNELYRKFMWLISHLWGQQWFWTKEWQEGERRVDEDIKAGRVHRFDNIDDFFASLQNAAMEDYWKIASEDE
jgi:hypothetical protein